MHMSARALLLTVHLVFWNGEDVVASSPFKKEYFNRKEFVGSLLNSVALPANAKVEYDTAMGSLSIALPKGASAKFDLSKHEVRPACFVIT